MVGEWNERNAEWSVVMQSNSKYFNIVQDIDSCSIFSKNTFKETLSKACRVQIDKWLETINGKSLHELIMLTGL